MTMEINLKQITIRDLVEDYSDDGDDGVRGYGGKLDIRPPFQRNFVYKEKQRNAVIETINKGFPLNVMYWATRDDGTYEVIDGQQRTISIAQYQTGVFSFNGRYFHNLQDDEQRKFLDYQLHIYECEGSPSEKLAWFEVINIAGEKLSDQELLNAVFAGPWVTDAKRFFSKPNSSAFRIGSRYVDVKFNRQGCLETAIKWIKDPKESIKEYMAKHQKDETATALWNNFRSVINRVQAVFPKYRSEMKRVDWGSLYPHLQNERLDHVSLENDLNRLMMDEDVTNKAGIYSYVLTGEERALNIRKFSETMKREAYERANGLCAKCGKECDISDMQADHIDPWSEGGKTNAENCAMLCVACNRRKSNK